MSEKVHHMQKSLGQNFLRDTDVIDRIIDVSEISSQDTVFEIGPGDGALTEALLETGARVVALEIDDALLEGLQERFGAMENFTLLHEDVRRFNLPHFLKENNIDKYRVIANLPYYITSSIIRFFLESEVPPGDMVIMVQKEVGERICACVGSLSVLGVSVQYFGQPEIAFLVPAEAFEPVPQVDSAILQISEIRPYGGHSAEYTKTFFKYVKIGYSARRKMIAKNLSNGLNIEKNVIEEMLALLGIKKTARAQELSMEKWHELVEKLNSI